MIQCPPQAALLWFLLLTISTFTRVGVCQEAGPKKASELIPLSLGNSWTYSANKQDFEKNETRTFEVTNRVVATRLFQQKGKWETWYQIGEFDLYYWGKNSPKGMLEGTVNYHAEEYREEIKDGETGEILPTIDEEKVFFVYPVKEGQKWKAWDGEDGDPPAMMELFDDDTKVTTEAGTFRCLHYQLNYPDGRSNYYIAPGVGIVRYTVKNDIEQTVYVLKKSQIAK